MSPDVLRQVMSLMGTPNVNIGGPSAFAEANSPINLLQNQSPPPTVAGVGAGGGPGPGRYKGNPRGMNRTGKVNTNINVNQNSNPLSSLLNRTFNIQK